jgi:hypothetical protein
MRILSANHTMSTALSGDLLQGVSRVVWCVTMLETVFAESEALSQGKSVVAPLDRVKILFQASNPDFQKYAGA